MRAIITSLATIILAPIIAGLMVEVAKPWLPEGAAIVGWVAAMLEASWLPWITAGAMGVLVGLWLDRFSAAFDGRHPLTKAGKARRLAARVHVVANECSILLGGVDRMYVDPNSLRVKVLIIVQKLAALGIVSPVWDDGNDGFRNVLMLFRALEPALQEGDLTTARAVAQGIRDAQIKQS